MPRLEVTISEAIIDWLINNLPAEAQTSETFQLLQDWKNGIKHPSFADVEKLSKKTHIPFGYFFLETPPQEIIDIVDFRTVDSISLTTPSRELIDTVDTMIQIQDWMRDYLIESGYEPVPFIGRFKDKLPSIEEFAEAIRNEFDLELEWFKKYDSAHILNGIKKVLRDNGIIIISNGVVANNTHRKLDYKEFRAFTLVDPYSPLIFINNTDYQNAKLFSLLHETAHLWLGTNSLYNLLDTQDSKVEKVEQVCNAVAAELLVPKQVFLNKWDDTKDLIKHINSLSSYFRCSKFVILRRARDYKKITQSTYNHLVEEFAANLPTHNKTPGGNFHNTLNAKWDPRFIVALGNSASLGQTSFSDVYRITGTKRGTFEELHTSMQEVLYG